MSEGSRGGFSQERHHECRKTSHAFVLAIVFRLDKINMVLTTQTFSGSHRGGDGGQCHDDSPTKHPLYSVRIAYSIQYLLFHISKTLHKTARISVLLLIINRKSEEKGHISDDIRLFSASYLS